LGGFGRDFDLLREGWKDFYARVDGFCHGGIVRLSGAGRGCRRLAS
jgi:hypothetical protein